MAWLGAVIGAGGSLLGGLLGNRNQNKINAQQIAFSREQMQLQRKWALQDYSRQLEDQRTQFVRLRSGAEEAGFNPLSVLGANMSAPGINPVAAGSLSLSSNNYMGQAIAESSLMLADAFAKTRAAQTTRTVEDLNRQREILQRKLTDATLRPKVPGVFGTGSNPLPQPQGGGNVGNAQSRVSGNSVDNVPDGGGSRPLLETAATDPRREVETLPVTSDSGFIMVDSPNVRPFYVPAINGEIPDILQYPTIAAGWAGTRMVEAWQKNSVQRITPEMRPAVNWADYLPKPKPKYQNRRATRFNPNHRDGYYYP